MILDYPWIPPNIVLCGRVRLFSSRRGNFFEQVEPPYVILCLAFSPHCLRIEVILETPFYKSINSMGDSITLVRVILPTKGKVLELGSPASLALIFPLSTLLYILLLIDSKDSKLLLFHVVCSFQATWYIIFI